MKKEDAYRDKSGCYVAFEYNGHVFVLKTIKGTANGKTWTNPRYAFCPISSDTEFAVRFTSVEEAIVAVKKIGLKVVYTQEWEVLENKNFNTSCVDKLKWKEWHEYQEVLRHAAPFAAIAVGNRVYKDTYSTALSDGNAWVFAAGEERLVGFSSRLTHKIDQLLLAIRQYPDMKLFDTEEERTEWSLKYLEEYAAKPEPTPVAEEQELIVAPHTHTVTAVLPATAPPDSTTELLPVGLTNVPRNSCLVHAFESQGTPKLRPVDIAELPPASVIEVDSYKSADVFISTATDNTTPTATSVLTTDVTDESWDVVDNNGMPHGVDAARKFISLVTASPDSLVTASPDSQPLTADSSIKTMKTGVTPQPSRSRIGKIAARPYEYVYDGPQQMGTTFVSRYRIDDEVWVLHEGTPRRMKITEIHPESIRGKVGVAYCFEEYTDGWGIREDKLYDTLFDLISTMTSISVEELIAAAKEVV